MAALPILGGFKILKDVVRISIHSPLKDKEFPAKFCKAIAEEKTNLPFLTCVLEEDTWGINVLVESADEEKVSRIIKDSFGKIFRLTPKNAILSLFPHKNNPAVTGTLFETLAQQGLEPEALANSPSAISVVLKEEYLNQVSDALFGPFSFSAYRTPSDWKLAQKGKEQLYKEVVASYQEKRPKVYGINYRNSQDLLMVRLGLKNIGTFGTILKVLAAKGLDLSFLASTPGRERKMNIFFCLPSKAVGTHGEFTNPFASQMEIKTISSAGMFSMTGPHFGDRFGIASELLRGMEAYHIDLLAFTCTIASIRGVVPTHQIDPAIQAIKARFEVPAVIKKD